jgi:hypothetical protein
MALLHCTRCGDDGPSAEGWHRVRVGQRRHAPEARNQAQLAIDGEEWTWWFGVVRSSVLCPKCSREFEAWRGPEAG